jgi:hypothetical protein
MSKESKHSEKKSDEIDLLDLINRMGRSLSRILNTLGKAFLYTFFFVLKKWLWLSLSLAVGVLLSYLIKFSTERNYSSDIILRSNTITNADMINHINKLHTFCYENNFDELAAALSVEREKVKYIKDIKAYWVIDRGTDDIPDHVDFKERHNVMDTLNVRMADRFVIRVKTSIPQELSVIRDGILAFVRKNQFFQQQNELRLKQAEAMLARIDYDVEQLDSLQQIKYFEESRKLLPREGSQMIFLQEQRTQLLHDDILTLINRRQEIEVLQTIYHDLITLLSDFTPPAKAENGALYYGRVVIPTILALAIILLLVFDNRKRLREVYRRY